MSSYPPTDFAQVKLIRCDECNDVIAEMTFGHDQKPNWRKVICTLCQDLHLTFKLVEGDQVTTYPHLVKVSPGKTAEKVLTVHFYKTLIPELAKQPAPVYELILERTNEVISPDQKLRDMGVQEHDTLIARENKALR
jgi:hypothetical protein